jgi:hypothetical protein
MRAAALAFGLAFAALPALAQDLTADPFADGANGDKIQIASGFVCPARIGGFERDAVGVSDVDTGTDFCAYAALDGVYGTIKLTPLSGAYDPKTLFEPDFAEQEKTGGKLVGEKTVTVDAKGSAPLAVYSRIYQTATLEDLHYYAEFTGAAVGNWAVEATIEYASPRNDAEAKAFLDAVYEGAAAQIAAK